MNLGNLALTAAAAISCVVGATYQGSTKAPSFPLSLFAQAKADDFIGDKACAECHEEKVAQFHKSGHSTFMKNKSLPLDKQGCEGCHGPGKIHTREENSMVISYTKMTPKQVSDACLRCHGDTMKNSHWHRTSHAQANVSCVSCHQIHPKEDTAGPPPMGERTLVKSDVYPAARVANMLLKADQSTLCATCHRSEVSQFKMNSHHPVPEGRLVCSDCHDIHPNKESKKHITVVKQTCVTCHAEIAGPFAFEHDPVAGLTGEGCAECHRAHGTNNPRLLKAFSRGLCSQCHTDKGANHHPGRSCWQAGCHVAIHGSNTDRLFLTR